LGDIGIIVTLEPRAERPSDILFTQPSISSCDSNIRVIGSPSVDPTIVNLCREAMWDCLGPPPWVRVEFLTREVDFVVPVVETEEGEVGEVNSLKAKKVESIAHVQGAGVRGGERRERKERGLVVWYRTCVAVAFETSGCFTLFFYLTDVNLYIV